jgi:hypothetical protein
MKFKNYGIFIKEKVIKVILVLLSVGLAKAFASSPTWTYRYDGPVNGADFVTSVAYSQQNGVYVAGVSTGKIVPNAPAQGYDLIVLNLDSQGNLKWTYIYNGDSLEDGAMKIIVGGDGNIYLTGISENKNGNYDLIVISLSPNGSQRWIYRYATQYHDIGYDIKYGPDGNIYVCGVTGPQTNPNILVLSLTPGGTERRKKIYNGPGDHYDKAYSLVCADGKIYVAGYACWTYDNSDLVIISYDYNGTFYKAHHIDYGTRDRYYSIIYGDDGYIYACGKVDVPSYEWYVAKLTLDLTLVDFFKSNIPGYDEGINIVRGEDGHLYTCGYSPESGNTYFTVIKLDNNLEEKWEYRHFYPNSVWGKASTIKYVNYSIIGGKIYSAGCYRPPGSGDNIMTLLCLNTDGTKYFSYANNSLCLLTSMIHPKDYIDIEQGKDGEIYLGAGVYEPGAEKFLVYLADSSKEMFSSNVDIIVARFDIPKVSLIWPNSPSITITEGETKYIKYSGSTTWEGIEKAEAWLSYDGGQTFPERVGEKSYPYPLYIPRDSIEWNVTQAPTLHGRIKVKLMDKAGPFAEDISDYDFKIIPARPTNLQATSYYPYNSVSLTWKDNSNWETGYEFGEKMKNFKKILDLFLPLKVFHLLNLYLINLKINTQDLTFFFKNSII